MCEIVDGESVSVCDVAIDDYRRALGGHLGESVSFTHVDYQPTLVRCHEESRLPEFHELVRQLMEVRR